MSTDTPEVATARAALVEYDRVMNLGRRYVRVDYSSDPTHVQYLRAVLAAHDAAVAERDAYKRAKAENDERVEELERGQASIHKATAAGRDAERAAVVAYLRRPCCRDDHDDRWCATCEDRDDLAFAIESGEHREGE